MSKTNLHKEKGRWKNVLNSPMTTKLKFYFNRLNYEFSYFTERKLKVKKKDLNKDMKNELKKI